MRTALVFGSNGPSWTPQLKYAEADSGRIAAVLHDACGFEVTHCTSETSSHLVLAAAESLAARAKTGDDLIIYFSGHGYLHIGRLFLLVSNTEETVFGSAINAKRFIDAMEFSSASHKLLILDCCHAGGAVGWKGGIAPPILEETETQLVLCASSRLEQAREFDELGAGFLTHSICEMLSGPRAQVTLSDVVEGLRKRAQSRLDLSPEHRVPTPYLFGAASAPFILKRPIGLLPIQIQLESPAKFDLAGTLTAMRPYLVWNISALRERCPLEVTLPQEITERVAKIEHYFKTDVWPTEISETTRQKLESLVESTPQQFCDELVRGVRNILAAGVREDRDGISKSSEMILSNFISAKTFALMRLYSTMRLVGEAEDAFRNEQPSLDGCFTTHIRAGLPWVRQQESPVSFWTDADLIIDKRKYRIYVPQRFAQGHDELDNLNVEELSAFVGPQLVEYILDNICHYTVLNDISRVVASRDITIRGGVFIDTEAFDAMGSGGNSILRRVERITANAIIQHLISREDESVDKMMIGLFRGDARLDVYTKIDDIFAAGATEDVRRVRDRRKLGPRYE